MKRLVKTAIIIVQIFSLVLGKKCNTCAVETLEHYPYLGVIVPSS
jgi:hypothetical protein